MKTISIKDFAKADIRVGLVSKAENVEGSIKLIKLTVNFGKLDSKTIFTGVRSYGYDSKDFENKQFLFVTNLEPKKIMNQESQGMILAVDGLDISFGEHTEEKPLFISAKGLPVGSRVR